MTDIEILERIVAEGSCSGCWLSCYGNQGAVCPLNRNEWCSVGFSAESAKQKLKEMDMKETSDMSRASVPELKGVEMLVRSFDGTKKVATVFGWDEHLKKYIGRYANYDKAEPLPAVETITPDEALRKLNELEGKKYKLEV